MVLGILSLLGLMLLISWLKERKKRLPPRYIKETERWYWLMNKHPLRVWNETGEHKRLKWEFKWTGWDLGLASWIPNTKKTNNHINFYPEPGDLVLVKGKYDKKYVFVITRSENFRDSAGYPYSTRKIESCYLGYIYENT